MLKCIYILSTLVVCCILLCCCEKRPFATVKICGRVLNFWDKSPVPSQIQLWVGGAQPGEKGTTNYGNYSTNADGTFNIESKAEWSGDNYTLRILPNTNNTGGNFTDVNCSVAKNKLVDVGDILTSYEFINCNINLNSVSGASIVFLQMGATSSPQTYFSAGTHTVITTSQYFWSSPNSIQNSSYFFPITYSLSTSSNDTTIKVPLNPPATTCSVTINY